MSAMSNRRSHPVSRNSATIHIERLCKYRYPHSLSHCTLNSSTNSLDIFPHHVNFHVHVLASRGLAMSIPFHSCPGLGSVNHKLITDLRGCGKSYHCKCWSSCFNLHSNPCYNHNDHIRPIWLQRGWTRLLVRLPRRQRDCH